jgi:quinol---cytochrome-c reductase cytochrome c subunit
MSRWLRRAAVMACLAPVAGVALLLVAPGLGRGLGQASGGAQAAASLSPLAAEGRSLFVAGCSSCHGFQARGIRGVAPSLRGVGGQAADFYLSTGRMPLTAPELQPQRSPPAYSPAQIAALDAYIQSFGGPPVPSVSTAGRSLSAGQRLYADNCSGCHQATARGGMVTGAFVPSLLQATPREVVEAARIGPYLMPSFGPGTLSDSDMAAIARYIQYVKAPPDRGGWGIGHIGPVPEGMVVWFIAMPFLLLVTRLIGERTDR